MECKTEYKTMNEEQFEDGGEISPESQKLNLQQNENYFEDGVWSSNVKTKIRSNIKSYPSNLDLSTDTIKHDIEINVKEEHFYQVKVTTELQKLHLLQSGTHFVDGSNEVDTKKTIKQELDPSMVSSDIFANFEKPSTIIGTGTVKDEIIDINEEPWWRNGITTEKKDGESDKKEASKDILWLESSRLSTDGIYSNESSTETEEGGASHKAVYRISGSQGTSMRPNLACHIQHFESKQSLDDKNTLTRKCETNQKCSIRETSCEPHIFLHSSKKLYKCEKCEKLFTDKANLGRHMLLHSGTKSFKCDICEKCFTEKSNLIRHILLHSGTKPFKCDTCQKCFTKKSDLKRHSLLHSGKKPHKCDKCEKCYAQKTTLQGHKLLHAGTKPYKCNICEKCYTHKSNLQRHSLVHSGTKPYKCDKCESCFKDKSNLRQHVLTHSGTKPYLCVKCEKCFRKKSDLKRHAFLHSNKKL